MSNRSKRTSLAAAIGMAAASATALLWASDEDRDTTRYPYDPACSWGRVANGKGMLLRCLTQAEALALSRASGPQPSGQRSASAPPSTERASRAKGPTTDGRPASEARELRAEVIEVRADKGKLPAAKSKLSSARSRFVQCVRDHGGLAASRGEAHVRFLVRERGRAEGVSVVRRKGISEAAAKCIADVVDRRSVGVPEVPFVGATVVVAVSAR